jgi:hypothetical protein
MESNEELLKDKAASSEPQLKQEPEEIKPDDADKIVGGMMRN